MEFNWMELVYQVFEIVVAPLLGVLAIFLINLIKTKTNEIKDKHNNETLNKYVDMLNETVSDCVLTTTQTYVDSIKKAGTFDADAQKTAFDMTFNNVINILSDDAKNCLREAVGDLDTYITTKIESQINMSK